MSSFANRYDYLLKNEDFTQQARSILNYNDKLQTAGGGGSWGPEPIVIPESTNSKILRPVQAVGDAGRTLTGNIADFLSTPFDFVKWVNANWQLAIVGLIALIVLIKD